MTKHQQRVDRHKARSEAVVIRYQAGDSIAGLAAAFGVTPTRIYQIVKASGTPLRKDPDLISDADKAEVIRSYAAGEATFLELIKKFKRGYRTISDILHGSGVNVSKQASLNKSDGFRKYPLDDRYFDCVDSERKAWLLGFIAADGSVSSRKGTHWLTIQLKASDRGVLETIKADLGYGGPVTEHKTVLRGKTYRLARIQIASVRLTDALKRLGIAPRKSLTLTPWIGPSELMRHYWRGIVDGDGHINKTRATLSLCGSEFVTKAFSDYCASITAHHYAAKKLAASNAWVISLSKSSIARPVIEHLYAGATISLWRKLDRAKQIIGSPRDPVEDSADLASNDE